MISSPANYVMTSSILFVCSFLFISKRFMLSKVRHSAITARPVCNPERHCLRVH